MLISPLPWMRCNRTWTAVDLIFCSPIKWFPRCPKQSGWVIRENHFCSSLCPPAAKFLSVSWLHWDSYCQTWASFCKILLGWCIQVLVGLSEAPSCKWICSLEVSDDPENCYFSCNIPNSDFMANTRIHLLHFIAKVCSMDWACSFSCTL